MKDFYDDKVTKDYYHGDKYIYTEKGRFKLRKNGRLAMVVDYDNNDLVEIIKVQPRKLND
jgi:hypothetical protein